MTDINYIINTYSDMILKIAYNFLGNIYDAEDITQQVLIKLMQINFEDIPNEKAFIIRVTINTCKNLKSSMWFKRVIGLDFQKLKNRKELRVENLNTGIFESESESNIVLLSVSKLKPKYRNVIFLYFYEEYSVSEIAEILEVKPQLVSTWLKRAKDKLKILLGDEYYEKYAEEI
ncbi:MAG: sigma-70 family RNA polymerase sigma factor [bacterium]